jgi:hypothetical protein
MTNKTIAEVEWYKKRKLKIKESLILHGWTDKRLTEAEGRVWRQVKGGGGMVPTRADFCLGKDKDQMVWAENLIPRNTTKENTSEEFCLLDYNAM